MKIMKELNSKTLIGIAAALGVLAIAKYIKDEFLSKYDKEGKWSGIAVPAALAFAGLYFIKDKSLKPFILAGAGIAMLPNLLKIIMPDKAKDYAKKYLGFELDGDEYEDNDVLEFNGEEELHDYLNSTLLPEKSLAPPTRKEVRTNQEMELREPVLAGDDLDYL